MTQLNEPLKSLKAYQRIAKRYEWPCRNMNPLLTCSDCGQSHHHFLRLETKEWRDYTAARNSSAVPGEFAAHIWACDKCQGERVWGSGKVEERKTESV